MSLRCKPGDLCVVIYSERPEIAAPGTFLTTVEVECHSAYGALWSFKDASRSIGGVRNSLDDPAYLVVVPDSHLHPIRPPAQGGYDLTALPLEQRAVIERRLAGLPAA